MTEKKTAKTAKSTQRKARTPFVGRWRITWMEQWDQEFVDEEVEGFFAFELNGCGSFQFGYVRGQIDYRHSTRDGNPCLEFSWDGNDEMDPAQGRGWAIAEGEQLNGVLSFHLGDESTFRAAKLPSPKGSNRTRRRQTNPGSR